MWLTCAANTPKPPLPSLSSVMDSIFEDFDPQQFWEHSAYAEEAYVDAPCTDEAVAWVESKLGYKLPQSYIALMRQQNGGIPRQTKHPMPAPTSWAADHIAITGIFGIGDTQRCSLCGRFGSHFWIEEWGYPAIGVYFADCPSAGHDLLCFDYRDAGPEGEPQVVHVDQELDYKITFVAENFAAFIRGLQGDEAFA